MAVLRRRGSSSSRKNAKKGVILQNVQEVNVSSKNAKMQHSLTTGFSAGFNWLFLPHGYPQSVSEDYLAYQVWDTLQGFCDYLKGILLTLSFLKGLGVGSSTGSLDAAMLVWIVRETTGVCCGLIAGMPTFTIHFSDRLQLRKWRLVSEAIKAVAGVIEICGSYFAPADYCMGIACVVIAFSTVAGVMGSQTRTALFGHFARTNNIPDCSAKEANQDRGVKLFGIPLALVLLQNIGHHPNFPLVSYIVLVLVQFVLNVMAVNSLRLG